MALTAIGASNQPFGKTEGEFPQVRTLTQEMVNEQINGFIAPLTRQLEQLEEMTRPVQRMVATRHPSHYPRADYCAIFGASTD